jgi:endonuclease G
MDESQIDWIANEGIRISRIMSYLSAGFIGNPIADALLAQSRPPDPSNIELPPNGGGCRSQYEDGELRVTIPVQIAIRVRDRTPTAATAVKATLPAASRLSSPMFPRMAIEKVDVDQSNYDQRTGYDPSFLGDAALLVPLPLVRVPP